MRKDFALISLLLISAHGIVSAKPVPKSNTPPAPLSFDGYEVSFKGGTGYGPSGVFDGKGTAVQFSVNRLESQSIFPGMTVSYHGWAQPITIIVPRLNLDKKSGALDWEGKYFWEGTAVIPISVGNTSVKGTVKVTVLPEPQLPSIIVESFYNSPLTGSKADPIKFWITARKIQIESSKPVPLPPAASH